MPFDDLRYLFGEIMYGGHITDDWDRRLCRMYLEEYIKPEMMEGELYLAPGFPLPGNMDYNSYHKVRHWRVKKKKKYELSKQDKAIKIVTLNARDFCYLLQLNGEK